MKTMKHCFRFFGAVGFGVAVILAVTNNWGLVPTSGNTMSMMNHFANWMILAYGLFGYAIGVLVSWVICCVFCRGCKSE